MSDSDDFRSRREILGTDGLHTRVRTWYPAEEWAIRKVFDPFTSGFFRRNLEEIIKNAKDTLIENGYPANKYTREDDFYPYTDAWYAGQLVWRCETVLEALNSKKMNNEMMLAHVMAIGSLIKEHEWRFSFRSSILTGAKQRNYLVKIRDGQNARARIGMEKRRRAINALMRQTELTGGALDRWLRIQLNSQHGIDASERTIRSDRKALRD